MTKRSLVVLLIGASCIVSAAGPATIAVDTPMPAPRVGAARAADPRRQRSRLPRVLPKVLRRPRLSPGLPALGRERRAGRCVRELQPLARAARARGRRRDPAALSEGLGRHDPPVLGGEDARRAGRPRRHVREGLLRAVRLDAPRRGAAALQPHGAVGARPARPIAIARGASPALYMGEDPEAPELRPGAQADSLDDQRQQRPDAAQGDGARLGRRSVRHHRFRRAARREHLRAVPRALPGIHRRRRRPLPEPGRDDAADQRLPADRRGEVSPLDRRLHGRVARAHEAERRHHPELRRSRRHDRRARRAGGGATPTAGDSARSTR